jgi:CheY-like chemotaxis protein
MTTRLNQPNPNPNLQVLLVDDDEVDVELIRRAFEKTDIQVPLFWAVDGQDGIEFLKQQHSDLNRPPFIVLLDLNMPLMNGIEFLDELRKDSGLSDTIVFALTTSDNDRDIVAAYDRNVAGYLVKSKVGDDFSGILEMIAVYGKYVEFPADHLSALKSSR